MPDECGLQVGEVSRTWVEGEWLAFDDQLVHRAWNRSDLDRVVLQLDLEHPDIAVPRRAHAVRFLAGIYFDLFRRIVPARRGGLLQPGDPGSVAAS